MNTRKAQKKVLPHRASKLKQRSSNQPLLVRGSAEWKRLFHTFLWRMCLSLSSLRVGSVSAAAVRDVGVKFLTLLNEFPRKGGRGQKRGEIQARFQFPISASSPSALSQMYRGKKAGKGGDRERRQRGRFPGSSEFRKRQERASTTDRVLLPSPSTASCPFKPQKQSKLNMGFQTAILAFHYLL